MTGISKLYFPLEVELRKNRLPNQVLIHVGIQFLQSYDYRSQLFADCLLEAAFMF